MRFYASSQIGIGKSENEDRMILGQSVIAGGSFITDVEKGIVAVADGVGGNNAGAVASHFVATRLSNAKPVSFELLSQINTDLIGLSQANPQYNNMATTVSGVCFVEDKAQIFHIGNTRVYALQGGKYLKQLTTDDTTLNYLIVCSHTHGIIRHFWKKLQGHDMMTWNTVHMRLNTTKLEKSG